MERSFYFLHQLVDNGDLNNTETTKGNQIIYRFQSLLGDSGGFGKNYSFFTGSIPGGGVFGSPSDYSSPTQNLFVSQVSSQQVQVAAGKALDVSGELIKLDTPKTCIVGNSDTNYAWAISASQLNYVKIRYSEASGSLRSDLEGVNSYYTRYTGSYFIEINGVAPGGSDILLATFVGDVSGWITAGTFQDRRMYVRPITPADGVYLDPTVKPVAAHTTVEDHVRSVGSGIPTTNNPHGIASSDLTGFTVDEHVRLQHRNGIILNSSDTAAQSSWQASLAGIPGINAYLLFADTYNATASIAGSIYTGSIPTLYASTAPADGYYYAGMNSAGAVSFVTGSVDVNVRDIDFLPLAYVQIVGGRTAFNALTDVRPFNSISLEEIQVDDTEGVLSPATTMQRYWNLNYTLERLRYQIGMAITGTPSEWNYAVPPLTAGPTSYADSYHTHAGTPGTSFGIGTGSIGFDNTSLIMTFYSNIGLGTKAAVRLGALFSDGSVYAAGSIEATGSILAKGGLGTSAGSYASIEGSILTGAQVSALTTTLLGGSASVADSYHTHLNYSALFSHISAITGTLSNNTYVAGNYNNTATPWQITLKAQAAAGYAMDLAVSLSPDGGTTGYEILAYNAQLQSGYALLQSATFIVPVGWTWKYTITGSNITLLTAYKFY